MSPRLIIFDFDGTLADSVVWLASVFNDVARAHGFRTIDAAEMAMLRGRGNREIVRYLGVPGWKMPFIAMDMRKRAAAAAAQLKLYADAPELLRELHGKGVTLAIVSSNGEPTVRQVLGPELAGLVSHYGCGASIFGKAAKFRAVLKTAGLAAKEALSVGDEVRDIEAARQVGIAAAAVSWGYATREILAAQSPDHLFDAPLQILQAIA
jgi:phosphoglycolate phosphatase